MMMKPYILPLFLSGFIFSSFMWDILYAESEKKAATSFETVKTPLMRVNSPAQKLKVSLRGAKDLYLVVTYGGDSYDFDQAVWAVPTLTDKEGNVVDMTTLRPVSSVTGWGTLLVNENHQKKSINIAGKVYEKGFFAHGPSVLHFKLEGKYESFEAEVGLDAGAKNGTVEFLVSCVPVQNPPAEEFTVSAAERRLKNVPSADKAPHFWNAEAAKILLEKGVEEIVFIRRFTLNSNHVYTDHVNSRWLPGGGLAILDLRTGKARDVCPELSCGVISRFDVSFDGKKILFDYKKSALEGYRIYEVNTDGTGLRQITFPPEDEEETVKRYKRYPNYHRGSDDMHPCYLSDGGIAFVSTRCQFSVLCDSNDEFTVLNLYRMDGDGRNIRPLSFSPLSEQSPVFMPDGRILYHRWEYVDKAAGNAKALWAMNPDGSSSAEVYGNTILFPETMIYGRPIPGAPRKIVFLGCSHCCPNNALGTVIVIDTNDFIRSEDTMKYITNDVRAFHHNGFHFSDGKGGWVHDRTGKPGRLFKDPYALNETCFLVACKPRGLAWDDPTGYGLSVLDEKGRDMLLYRDETISCWHPYPLKSREIPPVRSSVIDEELAKQNRAVCTVMDVYTGMEGVERGAVKYLRVLEQIPRPWSARKSYGGDGQNTTHAHSAAGNGSLSIKIQLGIIPVEEDGSAKFYVPANRAVYFQALDEKFRAIQTERTYVNYLPGETRSCIGCHETPDATPPHGNHISVPLAMKKVTAELKPQPGQTEAEFLFDYDRQIQPIWDKHCVGCHGENTDQSWRKEEDYTELPAGNLDLRGTHQSVYSVSYFQLLKLAGDKNKQLLGNRYERNEDAASNEIAYIPPYQTGALSSPLSGWLSGDGISLKDKTLQQYTQYLTEVHPGVKLSDAELLIINNWLDVNCLYHPSYWGRLNSRYEGHANYRPVFTVEECRMREVPQKVKDAEKR
ncbi:MAG: NPCBM/NEW2 domain-containing protein [Planctomycetia bacterium]|nr:NPCBM/NEW2 domain-containing protein [Planctomycetia bacterium]